MKVTINDIIKNKAYCPIQIEVIKDMGINLCSVESISWEKQKDGQLTNISIKFTPSKEK